ncbi:HAD-IIIA family hydrolase [Sediminibacillus dalangtanensis]|uniref:D,D-heptose 1,7-bisphosphate phosphatase n=1 Tax=Sediminibacillus dalangtanensis TaxID=2729421 RepID=A0ABX7VTQ2_9BACI|nr:HAD-IIIA family hydrolase [Sediminibacillus dalangtanensis]QTM98975.1 HAD-IIIA family hydrolase [Sediminibacillus dalangtanensis]
MSEIDAVFIDRDGTLGGDDTVQYPGTFELFPYSFEAITRLKEAGIYVFSFTNQPGISSGRATLEEFREELNRFGFTDVFICPHKPEENCHCRKPQPGMLRAAAAKYKELDLEKCVVIGDRWSDMAAADKVNATKILVKTGAGKTTLIDSSKIDYAANNLKDAVEWLYQSFDLKKQSVLKVDDA